MRKFMIGLIAATALVMPAAAMAQHRGDHDGGRGSHSEGRSNRGGGNHQGQARQAPQQRAAPQQAPQRQVRAPAQNGPRGDFRRNMARPERMPPQRIERVTTQRAAPQRVSPQRVRGDRGDRRDRGDRGRPGSVYPQAWQGNPNDPRLRHYQQLERRNQLRYGTPQQRRDIRRGDDRRHDWRRDGRRDGARDGRNWGHNWNRDWRGDRRYDWQRYRVSNRRHYHLSPYYAPYRNWSYRRFGIGFFLEPLFYSNSYWIGDPFSYRLPPAPPGTQWVRYYDDVLLVDIYSGEVIDAIYDFFW
jgi:hypothetical protein